MRALLFAGLLVVNASVAASTETAGETESPHFQAISLVMELRASEIAGLEDPDGKWHDVQDRTWSVRRPFHPGVLDTTHYFEVSYSIGGRAVATWKVNTKRRLVGDQDDSIPVE